MTDIKTEFIQTVLSLKDIPQSPKWHPEGDTLEHIKFIIHGITFKEDMGLINMYEAEFLTWVALFHDLGKIDTFSMDDNGTPHAYGHENYANRYIEKFQEIIPDTIDIDKLKMFCKYHMKAHQYMGTQMRETKKEIFRDQFLPNDFYLLMIFESCDSSHTLYDMLRRTKEYISVGYLEPIDFYNVIRSELPWNDDDHFKYLTELMIDDND